MDQIIVPDSVLQASRFVFKGPTKHPQTMMARNWRRSGVPVTTLLYPVDHDVVMKKVRREIIIAEEVPLRAPTQVRCSREAYDTLLTHNVIAMGCGYLMLAKDLTFTVVDAKGHPIAGIDGPTRRRTMFIKCVIWQGLHCISVQIDDEWRIVVDPSKIGECHTPTALINRFEVLHESNIRDAGIRQNNVR